MNKGDRNKKRKKDDEIGENKQEDRDTQKTGRGKKEVGRAGCSFTQSN